MPYVTVTYGMPQTRTKLKLTKCTAHVTLKDIQVIKYLLQYINYGGYQILVQEVFEGDFSCDSICKKLKF